MDDQSITDVPADSGAQDALPADADQTAAATDTNDQEREEDSSQGGDTPVPDTDEKLTKFAASHGLELDSPSAIKAAKIAMNNQAEFQRTRQKSSQLEKSMVEQSDEYAERVAEATGQDPELLKRLQRMEIKEAKRDFFTTNPKAESYEEEIKEKILKSGISGSAEAVLSAAWAMVQADNSDSLKSEGGREALQTLASKQRAAAPAGSAVNGGFSPKQITRQMIADKTRAGDVAWLNSNQDEINRRIAEGTLN